MKNKYENIIEEYLLGRLDADSAKEFEQRVQKDPELKSQVEEMRGVITAFEKRGEQEALAALQRLESEEELRVIINSTRRQATTHNRLRRIYLWSGSVAAAVIIAVSVGLQPQYSTQILYDTYHSKFQNTEITPSRGDENSQELLHDINQWNMAVESLKNGNRKACVLILNKLIESGSELSREATELKQKIEQRRWF